MTLHSICEIARRAEPCSVCHAEPGQACTAACHGVHLCRICLAAKDGLITMLDAASVMHDMDVFTGAALVPDGATA